jgi:hypothetical protein
VRNEPEEREISAGAIFSIGASVLIDEDERAGSVNFCARARLRLPGIVGVDLNPVVGPGWCDMV